MLIFKLSHIFHQLPELVPRAALAAELDPSAPPPGPALILGPVRLPSQQQPPPAAVGGRAAAAPELNLQFPPNL